MERGRFPCFIGLNYYLGSALQNTGVGNPSTISKFMFPLSSNQLLEGFDLSKLTLEENQSTYFN